MLDSICLVQWYLQPGVRLKHQSGNSFALILCDINKQHVTGLIQRSSGLHMLTSHSHRLANAFILAAPHPRVEHKIHDFTTAVSCFLHKIKHLWTREKGVNGGLSKCMRSCLLCHFSSTHPLTELPILPNSLSRSGDFKTVLILSSCKQYEILLRFGKQMGIYWIL